MKVYRILVTVAGWVASHHSEGRLVELLDGRNLWLNDGSPTLGTAKERGAAWTAPELFENSAGSTQSDVFVLGLLLNEGFTGVSPYRRVGRAASRMALLDDDRTPIPPARALSDALQALVDRCLSRQPADRPVDGAAFLSDLEQAWNTEDHEIVDVEPLFEAARVAREIWEDAVRTSSDDALALRDTAADALEHAQRTEREQIRLQRARVRTDADREQLASLLRRAVQRGWSGEQAQAALLDALSDADVAGLHQTFLRGRGRLDLLFHPPVDADLYRYEDRHGRMNPEPVGALGRSPIQGVPLPMGAYLVMVKAPVELRVPVFIGRRTRWHGVPPGGRDAVPLVVPEVAHEGRALVSAGWCQLGEPSKWVWVDGFWLERHPVTIGAWCRYLEDHLERGQPVEHLLPTRGAAIVVSGTRARPEVAAMPADVPIAGISFDAAQAYANSVGGRLPKAVEWEKAARGADARLHPWGNGVDPGFAAFDRSAPVSVDAFESDSSSYGVRGLGGNVRDWATAHAPEGFAVAMGGAHADRGRMLASSNIHVVDQRGDALVGLRVAYDL